MLKKNKQVINIAKALHGPSCGEKDCADCNYHNLPIVFSNEDKCHDYYTAIDLLQRGYVDSKDFIRFLQNKLRVECNIRVRIKMFEEFLQDYKNSIYKEN